MRQTNHPDAQIASMTAHRWIYRNSMTSWQELYAWTSTWGHSLSPVPALVLEQDTLHHTNITAISEPKKCRLSSVGCSAGIDQVGASLTQGQLRLRRLVYETKQHAAHCLSCRIRTAEGQVAEPLLFQDASKQACLGISIMLKELHPLTSCEALLYSMY